MGKADKKHDVEKYVGYYCGICDVVKQIDNMNRMFDKPATRFADLSKSFCINDFMNTIFIFVI